MARLYLRYPHQQRNRKATIWFLICIAPKGKPSGAMFFALRQSLYLRSLIDNKKFCKQNLRHMFRHAQTCVFVTAFPRCYKLRLNGCFSCSVGSSRMLCGGCREPTNWCSTSLVRQTALSSSLAFRLLRASSTAPHSCSAGAGRGPSHPCGR